MHENDLKRRHIYNMRRFHTAKTKKKSGFDFKKGTCIISTDGRVV